MNYSKRNRTVTGVTRTVTQVATGQCTEYEQVMGQTIYINPAISKDGERRFFVDYKNKVKVTKDEYKMLIMQIDNCFVIE